MPCASMNSTNPRTAPWNFHKKILRIGDFEKWPFFESAIFCIIPMKISHKGTQFLWLWWFTAKNHSPQTYHPAVTYKFGIGIWFLAEQGRLFPHRASIVRLSYRIAYRIISHRIVLYRITSHRIVALHIESYHIKSHRITTYHIYTIMY